MQTLIISDTACLILFDKIGEFEILRKLFQTVTITSIIAEEFKKQTPDWVIIKDPQNTNNVVNYSKVVDQGEASALALSIELEYSLLIFV
jgi:predicted nucleic acid-binding protein